jgi:hypothetical protein
MIVTRSSAEKQRVLSAFTSSDDGDPLEQVRAAENDVDVAVRQRIERPWENPRADLGADGPTRLILISHARL